jgi:signal transduction histidine kinase
MRLRQTISAQEVERALEWPRWAVLLHLGLPTLAALFAVVERDALAPPGWPLLAAAGALSPWLVEPFGVRVPGLAFVVVVLVGAGALLFGAPIAVTDHDVAPFLLVLLTFEMAAIERPWLGITTLVASIGMMAGVEFALGGHGLETWTVGLGLGWTAGIMLRAHLKLLSELVVAQETLAERAAADERRRIARDLHDAIAHSLGVMMLQITGARLALPSDPDGAGEALREAERQGRQSLADIRRTVGLLAPSIETTSASPPTASDIPELVAGFSRAGLNVDLDVRGDLGRVPPATGLALYRIVQESLTNVVKHAAEAPTRVAVEVDGRAVTIRVHNELGTKLRLPDAHPDGGLGLWGMRERAGLVGGTLHAGRSGGGWVVEASLPWAETAG